MRPWRCRVPQGWLSRQGGLARCPRPLPAAARVRGAGGSAIRPRSLSAASLAAPPAANAQPGPAAHTGQGPQPPPAAGGGAPHAPRSRRTPQRETPACSRSLWLRKGSLPQPPHRAGTRSCWSTAAEQDTGETLRTVHGKGKAKLRLGVEGCLRSIEKEGFPRFLTKCPAQRTRGMATRSR